MLPLNKLAENVPRLETVDHLRPASVSRPSWTLAVPVEDRRSARRCRRPLRARADRNTEGPTVGLTECKSAAGSQSPRPHKPMLPLIGHREERARAEGGAHSGLSAAFAG